MPDAVDGGPEDDVGDVGLIDDLGSVGVIGKEVGVHFLE